MRGSTKDDRLALLTIALAGDPLARGYVVDGVRRHLQGQHNQKSHGRKGGAGGRATAEDALAGAQSDTIAKSGWTHASGAALAEHVIARQMEPPEPGDVAGDWEYHYAKSRYDEVADRIRERYRDHPGALVYRDGDTMVTLNRAGEPDLFASSSVAAGLSRTVGDLRPGSNVDIGWGKDSAFTVLGMGDGTNAFYSKGRIIIRQDYEAGSKRVEGGVQSAKNGWHYGLPPSSATGTRASDRGRVLEQLTAHEMGHAVDASYDGRPSRNYAQNARDGAGNAARNLISGYGQNVGPGEAWADAYSAVRLGGEIALSGRPIGTDAGTMGSTVDHAIRYAAQFDGMFGGGS